MTFSRSDDSITTRNRRAVGVFRTRQAAEQALQELRDSGFPMERVSIIAKNREDAERLNEIAGTDVRDRGDNQADKGAAVGAASGGALGGLTGLLVGLGTLAIPGIGPVMLAGAAATALATTLAGGAIGAVAGGLIGALVGLGIPEDRARVYNERVAQGEYLVMVDGSESEIAQAEAILRRGGIEEYGVYDARDAAESPTGPAPDVITSETRLDPSGAPMASETTGRSPDLTPGVAPGMAPGMGAGMAAGAAGLTPDSEMRYAETTPMIQKTAESSRQKRAIGVFSNRQEAEAAIIELRNSGFPMERVSVIGKETDPIGQIDDRTAGIRSGTKADEGAKTGAAGGAALGGLGGLLVGLGTLAIPGIGPVLAGGAAATALATALSGGAIGAAAGGLSGALVGLGIPEDRARQYNDRLSRGDYLVILDGTEDEIRRAEPVLNRRNIQDWNVFDAADDDRYGDRRDTHDRNPLGERL